jgi:hypothetical protein
MVDCVIGNVEYALTRNSHAIRKTERPLRSIVEACFDVLPSFREVQLPKRILQPTLNVSFGGRSATITIVCIASEPLIHARLQITVKS